MLSAHYPRIAESEFEGALGERHHVGYPFLLPEVNKGPYVQASGACVTVKSGFETELIEKRNHIPCVAGEVFCGNRDVLYARHRFLAAPVAHQDTEPRLSYVPDFFLLLPS